LEFSGPAGIRCNDRLGSATVGNVTNAPWPDANGPAA